MMLAIERTGNCLVIITPSLTVTLAQGVNEAAIIQHSHVYTISAIGMRKLPSAIDITVQMIIKT